MILLILVAGLVALGVVAVRWLGDVISAEHERSSVASLPQPVSINECDPSDVSITASPSTVRVSAGSELGVSVGLLNEATRECSLSTSGLSVTLSVGDEAVWTPTACAEDDRTLLLAPEQEWVTAFKWDGGVYVDCNRVNLETNDDGGDPVPAKPSVGTYELTVSLAGADEKSEQEIVVE